ncbi:activating transcription factor 7a [Akanthomyces lecanii RCEF 1005]|uniref:Activating transcription factor 7a n=1 Tax=Akanthomyces lecanii RCEF 1005 TaxID=1081108 RepID=A0A167LLW0_CORDF|nr:activating transcription factor 7a [Akanthomyces lecanii RCEF 1005]
MRSKTKVLVASSKSTTTPAISRRGSAAAGIADKRRERNLERNRAAASKCRQRKKKWQDGLERKKAELENLFKALHSELKDLMEEVTQLKNFVMAHAGCNDANIDDWIRNAADRFVRCMSTARAQMHPTSAPPVSVVTGSMAQMQSLAQGNLAATLALNGTLTNEHLQCRKWSFADEIQMP